MDAHGMTDIGRGGCGDCSVRAAGDGHCCGSDGLGARTTAERAVLLTAGIAVLLLSVAALTVDSSPWVAVPAACAVLAATVLVITGARSLPGVHPRTATDVATGLRTLPVAVAALLVTLGSALVRLVL